MRPPRSPGALGSSPSSIRESIDPSAAAAAEVFRGDEDVPEALTEFLFCFRWVQAKGSMEKSMVADNDSGKSLTSKARTSSGAFLAKHEVITLLCTVAFFLLDQGQSDRFMLIVLVRSFQLSSWPSQCAPALARYTRNISLYCSNNR